ncbi:MAG: glycoside hydrolase family 113, partial [Candidatus Aminicenantales bacterium]
MEKRKTRLFGSAAVLLALIAFALGCVKTASPPGQRVFQKGVAFTGYSGTAYEGDAPLRSLDNLKQTDATWISLLVTGYQDTIHSTSIDFSSPLTPTDTSLERIIRYARSLKLKIMLKPHVDLLNDAQHYRGEIGPAFTAADWAAWFASYRPFILHYAELAAKTGCELYCVGCELGTTAVHAGEWRRIVADVRALYAGPLTYADNQIESDPNAVAWWDAVDFIGQ